MIVDHHEEDRSRLRWVRVRRPARIMEPGDPDHARAVAPLAAKYDQYRQRPHEGPVIAAEASERRARSAADAGAPRRP